MSTISKLSPYLFIDIETVSQVMLFSELDEKWQELFTEKNAKFLEEGDTIDDVYKDRAGILAEFGKIICISMGYLFQRDEEVFCKIVNISGHDEKLVLQKFLYLTASFADKHPDLCFVGHNIKEFDIPYICRRIFVNHLPFPKYLPDHSTKPWEVKAIDTLQWWKFGDFKNYISLELLSHVMQVPTSKSDIKGCDVWNVYYEGNDLPRIAEYCGRDVAVVANLLLRFNALPLLKEENIIVENEEV